MEIFIRFYLFTGGWIGDIKPDERMNHDTGYVGGVIGDVPVWSGRDKQMKGMRLGCAGQVFDKSQ